MFLSIGNPGGGGVPDVDVEVGSGGVSACATIQFKTSTLENKNLFEITFIHFKNSKSID